MQPSPLIETIILRHSFRRNYTLQFGDPWLAVYALTSISSQAKDREQAYCEGWLQYEGDLSQQR